MTATTHEYLVGADSLTNSSRPRALLAGTKSDAHTWGLVYLELVLHEAGVDVVNLGACVPLLELAVACRQFDPDAVIISSTNGHGYSDALELPSYLRSLGLTRPRLAIGGLLGTAGPEMDYLTNLKAAGFDFVHQEAPGVDGITPLLRQVLPRPEMLR